MEQSALRWCPHCRQEAIHAVVSDAPFEAEPREPGRRDDDPVLARRKLYCTHCSAVWEACEGPGDFIDSLCGLRDALDAAHRQITMLRLLLARERQSETISLSTVSLATATRRRAA
jgi:hypothetical protein